MVSFEQKFESLFNCITVVEFIKLTQFCGDLMRCVFDVVEHLIELALVFQCFFKDLSQSLYSFD